MRDKGDCAACWRRQRRGCGWDADECGDGSERKWACLRVFDAWSSSVPGNCGLNRQVSRQLALETVIGAAKMVVFR